MYDIHRLKTWNSQNETQNKLYGLPRHEAMTGRHSCVFFVLQRGGGRDSKVFIRGTCFCRPLNWRKTNRVDIFASLKRSERVTHDLDQSQNRTTKTTQNASKKTLQHFTLFQKNRSVNPPSLLGVPPLSPILLDNNTHVMRPFFTHWRRSSYARSESLPLLACLPAGEETAPILPRGRRLRARPCSSPSRETDRR